MLDKKDSMAYNLMLVDSYHTCENLADAADALRGAGFPQAHKLNTYVFAKWAESLFKKTMVELDDYQ